MKERRYLTLMIVPDTPAGEVRRLKLPHSLVIGAFAAAAGVMLTLTATLIRHAYLSDQSAENQMLRSENDSLRARADRLDQRLESVEQIVEGVVLLDSRLRASVLVSDPERHLAIGSVGASERTAAGDPGHALDPTLRRGLLGSAARSIDHVQARLSLLEQAAASARDGISKLSVFLEDQQALLSTTPSRAPAHGFISSIFGMRDDPFTGLTQMHAGLDFAASLGAPVTATADGLVIFASTDRAFGQLIKLDHGHGLITCYGHLLEAAVRAGDRVRRGQRIGAVGNTGRSTGPHLHYEVRLNGIAQDPRRFLLESSR